MRVKDADPLARGYFERRGWGEAFGHSLGHGIGLEVQARSSPVVEGERLAASSDAAVVTVEPGIYRPGWGGVRIEDDVLLTQDGREVLTSFPRELIELG